MEPLRQQTFDETISKLHGAVDNYDTWITANKEGSLQTAKKSGRLFRVLSSLLRILGIDVFSHVSVSNVADAIFKKVQQHGSLNTDQAEKLNKVLTWLNQRTRSKYGNHIDKVRNKVNELLQINDTTSDKKTYQPKPRKDLGLPELISQEFEEKTTSQPEQKQANRQGSILQNSDFLEKLAQQRKKVEQAEQKQPPMTPKLVSSEDQGPSEISSPKSQEEAKMQGSVMQDPAFLNKLSELREMAKSKTPSPITRNPIIANPKPAKPNEEAAVPDKPAVTTSLKPIDLTQDPVFTARVQQQAQKAERILAPALPPRPVVKEAKNDNKPPTELEKKFAEIRNKKNEKKASGTGRHHLLRRSHVKKKHHHSGGKFIRKHSSRVGA